MVQSSLDNVWKLLLEYEFVIDLTGKEELLCTLCHKILIKPLCGPCGCLFCSRCIIKHLEPGIKTCNGIYPFCRNTFLDMNTIIMNNPSTNSKIACLVVNCPFKICNVQSTLENMSNHIRVCPMKEVTCSYAHIGCENIPMTEDKLKIHDESKLSVHLKLLKDTTVNLSCEIQKLEGTLQSKYCEIDQLKEDSVKKEVIIMELKEKIENQKVQVNSLEQQNNNLINKLKILEIYDEKEIIWRIDYFEKKKCDEHVVRLGPFYRDSYKLYSCIQFKCDTLQWTCRIMKGEFDHLESVKWPMKQTVTLSILNQLTMTSHRQKKYSYDTYLDKKAFDKPESEINTDYFGSLNFIGFNEIIHTPGLLIDDSLVVSFRVDNQ